MDKRVPIGVVMVVAGTVAMLFGLGPLIDEGSCASGGPYVVENECPSEYAWLFWVVLGGFLVAFAGMLLVFVVAGEPAGFLVAGAWFIVLGVTSFVAAQSLEEDARLGLNIVGWVFAPMGIGSLVMGRAMHRSERRRFSRRRPRG